MRRLLAIVALAGLLVSPVLASAVDEDGPSASFAIVGFEHHGRSGIVYLAESPKKPAALELRLTFPAKDATERGMRRASLRLRILGRLGEAAVRRLLVRMHAPAPTTPFRSQVLFDVLAFPHRSATNETNETYEMKLFAPPGKDEVEVYLNFERAGNRAVFVEKDEGYRPMLTRIFTK